MPLMIEEVGLARDGTPTIRLLCSKDDVKRAAKLFGDEVVLVPAETLKSWASNAATRLFGELASSIGQYVPQDEPVDD